MFYRARSMCSSLRCGKQWLVFGMICVIAFMAQFLLFMSPPQSLSVWLKYLAGTAGDAAVAILPYIFLAKRRRWIILPWLWLVTFWLLINRLFYHFWGDIMSVDHLFMFGNVDSVLAESAIGLLEWPDAFYLVAPTVATIFYIQRRRVIESSASLTWRGKFACVAGIITIFAASQLVFSIAFLRYRNNALGNSFSLMEATAARVTQPVFSRYTDIGLNGITVHFFRSVARKVSDMFESRQLSREELFDVRDFIASHCPAPLDSIAELNKDKNIVLIIVESLNANVIDRRVAGREVTPTLNSLVRSPGTLAALNVVPQIKDGGSSDGQLIYNTGMLPLASGAASMQCSNNRYESLVNLLGRKGNVAVFGDDAKTWNQRWSYLAYGFHKVHSRLDFADDVAARGTDAALLSYAGSMLSALPQPFFIELITMSMHVPFTEAAVATAPWLSAVTDLSKLERDYLNMCAYFDGELARFIARLKEDGLYNDTMIVIMGDHSQSVGEAGISSNLDDAALPTCIMYVNCGVGGIVRRTVGQVDMMPTLLQFTGRQRKNAYNGLGHSMLNPDLNSSIDGFGGVHGDTSSPLLPGQKKAYDVSRMMMRSDFFNQYQ